MLRMRKKKIITTALILSMCVMTAFSSFASGVAGNIDNQNASSGPVGTGGDLGVTGIGDKSRIGLRFSLIDSTNPEQVVSVNMAGEPTVIDLWFMSTDRFIQFTSQNAITNLTADNYFTAVKTQSIDTRNSDEIFTWSDIAGLGIFDDIEPWITYNNSTSEFVATGIDFQSWEEEVIPVANSEGVVEDLKYGHIINMLEYWRDSSGNLVFGTADTRAANTSVTDITVPSNKNYKLLIEPITMFTPCYAGTSKPVTTKVAGTLSNIAEYWTTNETLSALDSKYGAKSHLNWKFFNKTGIHSLAVTETMVDTEVESQTLIYEDGFLTGLSIVLKEVYINNNVATFENGSKLTKPSLSDMPSMRELAEMNQWKDGQKVGYAVNVFSLDGLLQTSSHTWNSSKYPNGEPGEAPDTPYVSDEENFVSVVKYYEESTDGGTTYETVGVYGKENCASTITIENEPLYKVKEFFLTTNESSYIESSTDISYGEQKEAYKDVPVSGTRACSVGIAEPAKVLHILYQKSDGVAVEKEPEVVASTDSMVLYQNEISRPYDLSILTENHSLYSLYEIFGDKSGLTKTCNKSHDLDDDCRGNDEDGYWCDGRHSRPAESVQEDGNYSLSVRDSFNYNSETAFIRDYLTSDTSVSGSVGLSGGETEHFEPNASYLFYRNYLKDKVTLYPEKNTTAVKSKLKDFSIISEAYVPGGTRIAKVSDSDNGSKFSDDFNTHFEDTTTDRELSYEYECDYGHRFDETDYESEQRMSMSELNGSYSATDNAITEVYLGQANSGNAQPSDTRTDTFTKKYNKHRSYSLSEAELKFYPAIEMKMIEKDNSEQAVYVTSENLSTMKVFNAVQVGAYKKNVPNLNLSSTQWSTHRKSLSFLASKEIDDKQTVLPGGAIVDLDFGKKGDFQLGVRSYQACLPDEQVKKVADSTSFNTSLTKAKEQSNQLFADIKQSLEGYGLEMYVYEGVTTDIEDIFDDGRAVHSGDTVKFQNRGVQTSKDSKYYLRQDGEGANRANFDVLDSRIESQIVYTIKSDTTGNVILYKDGVELARAGKTQNASIMLSNSEIKLLDDNTKLITNYFAAIDRNKGLDKEKQHWYNECFDGVSVLVTDYVYDIGFAADSSVRSTVIDTKLLGKATSKSDLYSFEEDDMRSLVFMTTERTTSSRESNNSKGFIATLEGFGTMKPVSVYIKEIQYLAFTKIFYINNFSVSDLN